MNKPDQFVDPDRPELIVLSREWDRLHKYNEHYMHCLVGQEGSGKSMTAITIAQMLDPDFCVDRILFDVQDLLEMLNNREFEQGQAIVLDEAGVSLGRRTWQDRAQVLANQALQLIRSHNLALLFTLPALGELDSQAVNRLHSYYQIDNKVDGQFVAGSWYYIKTDRSDENRGRWTPKPRIKRDDKPNIRIDSLAFAPPAGDIVTAYQEKKRAHQQRTYAQAIEALSDGDGQDDTQEQTAQDIADAILEQGADEYVGDNHGQAYIEQDLIAVDYSVGRMKAKRVKKVLQREGVANA